MSRYFTRAAKAYKPMICEDTWYNDPLLPGVTVSDHDAIDTGLVDGRGDPILRGPESMGFHNPRERA
jgi:hypothetical protein